MAALPFSQIRFRLFNIRKSNACPMAVDLRKLRNAIEVSNSGSITLAARNLFITQSALTRSISDLEAELGVLLFQRTPKGVLTTDVGREFVIKAQRIVASVDELIDGLTDYRELRSGRLRLGFASAMFQRLVAPSLMKLIRAHPGLGVELFSDTGEKLVPKLVSGEIDLLLGTERHLTRWAELSVQILTDLHCKLMVRPEHPLTSAKKLTPQEVLQYPVVQASFVEYSASEVRSIYSLHNLEPRDPHYLCDDFDQVKGIVKNSDAFSLVFSTTGRFGSISNNFELLENVIGLPPQQLALATYSKRLASPAVTAFQETVQKEFGAPKN